MVPFLSQKHNAKETKIWSLAQTHETMIPMSFLRIYLCDHMDHQSLLQNGTAQTNENKVTPYLCGKDRRLLDENNLVSDADILVETSLYYVSHSCHPASSTYERRSSWEAISGRIRKSSEAGLWTWILLQLGWQETSGEREVWIWLLLEGWPAGEENERTTNYNRTGCCSAQLWSGGDGTCSWQFAGWPPCSQTNLWTNTALFFLGKDDSGCPEILPVMWYMSEDYSKATTNTSIAYASRAWRDAETRYSTSKMECLAIVWAVKKFSAFLFGKPFTCRRTISHSRTYTLPCLRTLASWDRLCSCSSTASAARQSLEKEASGQTTWADIRQETLNS